MKLKIVQQITGFEGFAYMEGMVVELGQPDPPNGFVDLRTWNKLIADYGEYVEMVKEEAPALEEGEREEVEGTVEGESELVTEAEVEAPAEPTPEPVTEPPPKKAASRKRSSRSRKK